MNKLKAVLWDMDGTLVDTEILWDKAIYSTMDDLGSPLSEDDRAKTIGLSMPDLVSALHGFSNLPDSPAARSDIERGIFEKMVALYRSEMAWRPGARELMTEIHHAGFPQALVTNTQRNLTNVALQSIGDYFEASVCGDEVPQGKPAADPYRKATQMLGYNPASCLVLEDSQTGISSGVAAGCTVIGISSGDPLKKEVGCTLWDSLEGVTLADLQQFFETFSS